jgi:hypothetical protein
VGFDSHHLHQDKPAKLQVRGRGSCAGPYRRVFACTAGLRSVKARIRHERHAGEFAIGPATVTRRLYVWRTWLGRAEIADRLGSRSTPSGGGTPSRLVPGL